MIATKNTTAAKRTPYCDTCYRKGLSEKEYTSHYTKSEPGPRGVVVCPTILNAVCKACGMKGHWASEKFCSVVRREARQKDRMEQDQKRTAAAKPVAKKTTTNVYAALMDDEGEAVDVAPPVASLRSVAALRSVASHTGPSWADMAAKPAVLVPKVEEPSPLTPLKFHTVYYDSKETKYEPLMTDAEREAYKIMNERKAAGCFAKRNSWLDLSDDEEEEEEW